MDIRKVMMETFGMVSETIVDKFALKAILLAGGTGSGKSYVLNRLKSHVYPLPKVVDSDKLFEAKLIVNKLPMILEPEGTEIRMKQTQLRNQAISTYSKIYKSLLNGFMPMIIDGTGKNYEKHMLKKRVLEDLGYDVMCLMINTSLDVAQERNRKRERKLPPEEVEKYWRMCQDNFPRYLKDFTTKTIVDNNPGMADIVGTAKIVNKFLNEPVTNPLGIILASNNKEGSITREVDPESISVFNG
jgi:dephospho-CoA kinase